MRSKLSPRFSVTLATLLLLWSGSLGSIAHAAAPAVTILGLRVNGVNTACGATVQSGDQVCVRFRSDQNATAVVSVTKGTTTTVVASGSVLAGVNYITCVTAGIADNITRTFTVALTNTNGTDSAPCTYKVATTATVAPQVTILGLRVNGVNVACDATVQSGDQVCVRFRSNQDANAVVSVTKGTTTTVVASGSVVAGVNYITCVTAGIADNITRTFTVALTNANGTDSQTCDYKVSTVVTVEPNVTIHGLRVNGVNAGCGAMVHAGDQVCVRFSSDQNANAVVSVTKGTTTTVVASGSVVAGVNYITCVTAGTADSVTRTFTVKASTGFGMDSKACTYTVVP